MTFKRESKPGTVSKVYRYFDKEEYAQQFLQGNLRLSTLQICRGYENPYQGDQHEGELTYYSEPKHGEMSHSNVKETARRLGISLNTSSPHVHISHCSRRSKTQDAYVFCTSTAFNPAYFEKDFGQYCVEIIDPGFFMHKIVEQVHKINPIREAHAGHIEYAERTYQGLEKQPANGHASFIKPPIYAPQSEYRFILYPEDATNINYLDIECRKIRGLLKRLN